MASTITATSRRAPLRVLIGLTFVSLVAAVAGAVVASPSASSRAQPFECEVGELVGDQCRIVGPAPQCFSPAQGTPPDCFESQPPFDCVSPYESTADGCRYWADDNFPWYPIFGPGSCPPTGGPVVDVFGPNLPPFSTGSAPITYDGCEYFRCPSGGVLVGKRCRVPVPPSCPDPYDYDDGQCIRFVPALLPGKVTLTYDAACGPDGLVGLVDIQIATENGAAAVAITINGSASTSTRVDPGGPIDVAVLTNDPNDEIVIDGPTTAPICASPTPTPGPTTPPVTPTPIPTATPTPDPEDDVPLLSASVTPGDCVSEGERSAVLTASLSPASATDLVQWSVDFVPVGGAAAPGSLNVSVAAGGSVEFTAEVLDPSGVDPFVTSVDIEPCITAGDPSVEVGPCDASGLRELILLSTVGDEVQWFVDGEPIGPPGPPGPLMGSVVADGGEHVVELVVVEPPDLAGLTETVVVEACERAISITADVGDCVADGRQVVVTVIVDPSIIGDLVQLTVDGAPVGAPIPPATTDVVVVADGAEHVVAAGLTAPATGATAAINFVVDSCPQEPVTISATALRQHGRSEVVLPAECADASVEIPEVDQLVEVQTGLDGSAVFTTDSTTLPVGEHVATVDCAGVPVEVTIFVYHQIGGSRGEARGVTVASGLGLAGLALLGVARRRFG